MVVLCLVAFCCWFDIDPSLAFSAIGLQTAHGILPDHRQTAPIRVLGASQGQVGGWHGVVVKDPKEIQRIGGIRRQKGIGGQTQEFLAGLVRNPGKGLAPVFDSNFVAVGVGSFVGTFGQLDFETLLGLDRSLTRSTFRSNKRHITIIITIFFSSLAASAKYRQFVVFDSDTVNAWVLPNGKVGFYKGILDIMETDDHLATVMGHEVGHVAGRHSAERASQQIAAQVGVSLLTSALGANQSTVEYSDEIGAALGMGVTLGVILPYSRQHEYEADRLGVDYMARSSYDPRQAVDFWVAMSTLHRGSTAEFMSTHPSDENRITAMRAHMQAQGYT